MLVTRHCWTGDTNDSRRTNREPETKHRLPDLWINTDGASWAAAVLGSNPCFDDIGTNVASQRPDAGGILPRVHRDFAGVSVDDPGDDLPSIFRLREDSSARVTRDGMLPVFTSDVSFVQSPSEAKSVLLLMKLRPVAANRHRDLLPHSCGDRDPIQLHADQLKRGQVIAGMNANIATFTPANSVVQRDPDAVWIISHGMCSRAE